jgi:hypothetical protein
VDESILSRLLPDLHRAWSKQPAQVDVSRIYGKDGVIDDPRTGVKSNRIKEVLNTGFFKPIIPRFQHSIIPIVSEAN